MNSFLKQNLSKQDYLKYFSSISNIAGAKVFEYKGGKSEGTKGIDVKTGTGFRFTVIPDRGMDVLNAEYCGMPISWVCKNNVVHPSYYENGGIGFLRTWGGGLTTTTGLTQAGDPCLDGDEVLGIHGRINHTPADKFYVEEYWEDDEYIIKIKGEMRESALYYENLVLKREIICKLGENKIYVNDEFVNEGFKESPFMFTYHVNFGYPVISPDTTFFSSALGAKPWNKASEDGSGVWDKFTEPKVEYDYEVYEVEMPQEKDKVYAAYVNEKLNFGAYLSYSTKQLPYAVEWFNMAPQEYVAAIEPGNVIVWGREIAKQKGVLKYIKPGESYTVNYEIGVLADEDEINELKSKI